MDSRVALQPAYVLHTQPFQNTSLLVDFFTMDYGRIRAVDGDKLDIDFEKAGFKKVMASFVEPTG